MREYSNKITLTKNFRGVYSLDPSFGCYSGMLESEKGCYNDCYAARYSKKYGYDFSKTVLRCFENETHKYRIIKEISKINSSFIRMGTSGDPSENWEHTIKIIKAISTEYQLKLFKEKRKEIVIITKHWNKLTDNQLINIKKYNLCINTSISALDKSSLLNHRIEQYERLKPYCKSILRLVSADFNTNNKIGNELNKIQSLLFKNYDVLDTIFRVYKKNKLVISNIINIKEIKFMGKRCNISRKNKHTHFGSCNNCNDKCGINKDITA